MKNILFLFLIIASVVVCSCKSGGSDDQNNASGNELYNVDSISVDQFEDLLEDYISSEDVAGIQRLVATANSTLNRITNKAEKTVFADKVKSIIRANESRLSRWFDVNALLENILSVVPDVNTQIVEQSVQTDSNAVYHSGSGAETYDDGMNNPTNDDPSQSSTDPGNSAPDLTIPGEEPSSTGSNSGSGSSSSNASSPTTPSN